MHDDTPLTSIGDEPVEARIVAWVLGEASGFEAAELERLCEQRPELLVFRRRMLALHGLLTEAEAAQPDEAWKLPPEKRQALDEIFGANKPVPEDPRKEKRIRRSGYRAFFAIAACLVLTCVVMAIMGTASKSIESAKKTVAVQGGSDLTLDVGPRDSENYLRQLNQAVRDQEDKVDDQRKILKTIAKTKSILGSDGHANEDAIKRGLEAQDYGDAKRELESDEELLQQMRIKQLGETIASKTSPGEARGLGMSPLSGRPLGGQNKDLTQSEALGKKIVSHDSPKAKQRDTGHASAGPLQIETRSRELAAARVPLKTELPPEMIEGTPKPIVLPPIPAEPAPQDTVNLGDGQNAATSNVYLWHYAAESKLKAITKSGAGTLGITGSNTYTGGITGNGTLTDGTKPGDRLARNDEAESPQQTKTRHVSDPAVANSPAAPTATPVPPNESVANDHIAKQQESDLKAQSAATPAPEAASKTPPTLPATRAPRARIVPPPAAVPASPPAAAEPPPPDIAAADHVIDASAGSTYSIKPIPPAAGKPASGRRSGAGDFVSPVGGTVGTLQGAAGGPDIRTTDDMDTDADDILFTDGIRSGDEAINRNSIDAILNNPNRVAQKKESLTNGKNQAADKIPVLGELPFSGRLFTDNNRERKLADLNGRQDASEQEQGQAPDIFSITGLPSGNLDKAIHAKLGRSDKSDHFDIDMTNLPSLTGKATQHELDYETHTGYFSSNLTAGARRADSLGINYYLTDEGTKITPPPVFEGFINYGSPIQEGENTAAPDGKTAADKEQLVEQKKALDAVREIMPDVDPEAGQLMDVAEAVKARLKAQPATKELRDHIDHKEQPANAIAPTDAGVALAMQDRKVGKYSEAHKLLEGVLAADPNNATAKRELSYLDDPIRTNPALTNGDTQDVDKVRRGLYTAEGNYNLGKYDAAKREYENVLRTDPYNSAARRGMEKLAKAKTDYYRAAYDQTRAELLSQVDAAWELPVPDEKTKEMDAKSEPEESNSSRSLVEEAKKIPESKSKSKANKELPADAEALQQAIKEQEDKVEDRRKALATIVRTKGIIYKGSDSSYGVTSVIQDQGAADSLPVDPQTLAQDVAGLESQITCLLKYDKDELMVYAGGLDLPENVVKVLYPKYKEAKRQLEGLKINGLADNHPTVRAANEQVATMKRQLDEGVVSMRQSLIAQLNLARERAKKFEAAAREEAIKRGVDTEDYLNAKRDFENDQKLLNWLKSKLADGTDAPLPVEEKPKPDLTKLIEEVTAAEEPYSTFSLNISDASFKVAQAALAKGERPDPAGIKVEQFYNAVDYGDPSPTAGEPVAMSIDQAAHPFIPGRNLVRVALKTAAAGRAASQPLRLTLLVDQSGSMVRDDRRAAMDKALTGLSSLLTPNDQVTVIGFARTPRLLADSWTGEQAAKLAELINQTANEGGTNLEEAIKLGEQMAERHKLANAQNRIVLFTDGAANLGDADPAHLATKVKALRQKGIAFDIAGIAADDLNDELLGELARNGNGRYYVVGKGADDGIARQLAGAFRPAAENVKVQVHFNQERVARYKLIGFEKDRLKTEDFRNDAVDAAEMAAEEAGVAIYQVEPIPGGTGELGDVSVRFRDTASGQMVERKWNIPHDASAPAIDRAKPSMQLATLAMLAGDKLRGGPLADAIDFKQLVQPRANVKHFYGNTGRAAEVLRMIDQL